MKMKKYDFGNSHKKQATSQPINEIICILDASGSMESQKESTIAGFNKFLRKQKQNQKKGTKTLLTLATFNTIASFTNRIEPTYGINKNNIVPFAQFSQFNLQSNYSQYFTHTNNIQTVYNRTDINEVSPLCCCNYKCDGGTPLFDSIGTILSNAQTTIVKEEKAPHSVMVVIITDGEENCSNTWNKTTIRSLIDSKKNTNWNFLFLGAGVDNFTDSYSMGLQDFSIKTTTSKKGYEDAWRCINDACSLCQNSLNGTYNSNDLNNISMSYSTTKKIN